MNKITDGDMEIFFQTKGKKSLNIREFTCVDLLHS